MGAFNTSIKCQSVTDLKLNKETEADFTHAKYVFSKLSVFFSTRQKQKALIVLSFPFISPYATIDRVEVSSTFHSVQELLGELLCALAISSPSPLSKVAVFHASTKAGGLNSTALQSKKRHT